MIAARAAALARASHPEPVAGVTVMAAALAYTAGRGVAYTAVCGAAVLAGQLFVGWSNDLLDARLDAAQGRSDKPIAAGRLSPGLARGAAATALIACVPLSVAAGPAAAAAHFGGLGAATLYNAGLKRTIFSVVPYAVAFGLLPAFVTLGPPITHVPAGWATAAAALAGAAAHFTQVLPDIRRDLASGIRGLPQRLGERASAVVAVGLFGLAATLVALGAPSPPLWAALAATVLLMAGVLGCVVVGRLRAAFRLTLAAAGLVVAALLLGGADF